MTYYEHDASMRPRVFPAEDLIDAGDTHDSVRCFNEAAGIPRGRHFPGEQDARLSELASMRPRVFPAEDDASTGTSDLLPRASMRPRVFPAEDSGGAITTQSTRSFNEAAGIPRGRRRVRTSHTTPSPASMRPRVFPAEDIPVAVRTARPYLLQ